MICAGCSSREMSNPLFFCFSAPSRRICVASTVFPTPDDRPHGAGRGLLCINTERRLNATEDLQALARCDLQGVLSAIKILASTLQGLQAALRVPTVSFAAQLDDCISEKITRLHRRNRSECAANFERKHGRKIFSAQ